MDPSRTSESDRPPDAAGWLAKRDRGFTAAEHAAFRRWLAGDPRREGEVRALESAWNRLDRLRVLMPAGQPECDMLVSPPRIRRRWIRAGSLAAAAAVIFGVSVAAWREAVASRTAPLAFTAQMDGERSILPDGSVAELSRGAAIAARFTPSERRVELVRGEANFIVAKNPHRPFLVSAGGVVVRAVGTVFDVRLGANAVEVIVSEGRVRVARGSDAPLVSAGERLVVPRDRSPIQPVEALSHERVERLLAWSNPQLAFSGQTLAQAIEQFNRYNAAKLVIGDAATARIAIGGRFRAHQEEAFVRLLTVGFGIRAESRGGEIVLSKEPQSR